jgi:hypothetical protein
MRQHCPTGGITANPIIAVVLQHGVYASACSPATATQHSQLPAVLYTPQQLYPHASVVPHAAVPSNNAYERLPKIAAAVWPCNAPSSKRSSTITRQHARTFGIGPPRHGVFVPVVAARACCCEPCKMLLMCCKTRAYKLCVTPGFGCGKMRDISHNTLVSSTSCERSPIPGCWGTAQQHMSLPRITSYRLLLPPNAADVVT